MKKIFFFPYEMLIKLNHFRHGLMLLILLFHKCTSNEKKSGYFMYPLIHFHIIPLWIFSSVLYFYMLNNIIHKFLQFMRSEKEEKMEKVTWKIHQNFFYKFYVAIHMQTFKVLWIEKNIKFFWMIFIMKQIK